MKTNKTKKMDDPVLRVARLLESFEAERQQFRERTNLLIKTIDSNIRETDKALDRVDADITKREEEDLKKLDQIVNKYLSEEEEKKK
ncbi:MAG: hypothetical protein HYT34_01270 [Candidatus Ryanbacteria bacterium]|nr:hypothetical protein [Candidatus Ryanbacteria bacterium]